MVSVICSSCSRPKTGRKSFYTFPELQIFEVPANLNVLTLLLILLSALYWISHASAMLLYGTFPLPFVFQGIVERYAVDNRVKANIISQDMS